MDVLPPLDGADFEWVGEGDALIDIVDTNITTHWKGTSQDASSKDAGDHGSNNNNNNQLAETAMTAGGAGCEAPPSPSSSETLSAPRIHTEPPWLQPVDVARVLETTRKGRRAAVLRRKQTFGSRQDAHMAVLVASCPLTGRAPLATMWQNDHASMYFACCTDAVPSVAVNATRVGASVLRRNSLCSFYCHVIRIDEGMWQISNMCMAHTCRLAAPQIPLRNMQYMFHDTAHDPRPRQRESIKPLLVVSRLRDGYWHLCRSRVELRRVAHTSNEQRWANEWHMEPWDMERFPAAVRHRTTLVVRLFSSADAAHQWMPRYGDCELLLGNKGKITCRQTVTVVAASSSDDDDDEEEEGEDEDKDKEGGEVPPVLDVDAAIHGPQ